MDTTMTSPSPTFSNHAHRPETPLNEDPVLGLTMLPSSGEGENNMKCFIQEHLTTILQPLAETVHEIQRSIRQIKDDTALANTIADRNLENIASHEQKLLLFGSGLARISDDMSNQRTEMAEVMDRQVNIEGEVDLTKVGLSKNEGYLQSCITSSQEVRKMIDDVDSRLRQVQLSVSETNVNHMAFADRLSEVRNLHDGLNDRHMQMMTSLQQCRQSDENTRSQMKRHIATFDKQKKDVQRSFTLLDDRLKSAEAMLLDTTHKTQNHAKNLKQMTSDVKHLLAELGEVVGVQQGLNATKNDKLGGETKVTKQESVSGASAGFGNRMGRLEESIALLNRSQGFEKENMSARCKELEDLLKKTMADTRDQSVVIEHTSKTVKIHEERVLRNETKIAQTESGFENLKKMCDKVDNDTRAVVVNLRELTGVVEFEKHEREKTNASIANMNKDLSATNGEMQNITRDHLEMQGSLAKIGMRLELAHEYFQGTCKGFQDTHKRVTAGLDGMVPPKTVTNRKMLPEIPGSKASRGGAHSEVSSPSPSPP